VSYIRESKIYINSSFVLDYSSGSRRMAR
jgi:hypothetical protein